MKVLGLGSVAGGSAQEGIRCTGSTNATPIVLTLTAGHQQKNGNRVVVSGITGNTGANGEWTLSAVGATTATLDGSVGNGTHGGTPVVRALCDRTPFMQRGSAAAAIGATDAYDGVVVVESSADDTTYADAIKGVALGAGQDNLVIEVELGRYMQFRSSTAGTTGAASAQLLA